jgi:hypothetical protein
LVLEGGEVFAGVALGAVFYWGEVVLCKRGGICDDREMWSVVGEPVTLRF